MSTRIYTVHVRPPTKRPDRDVVFVKEGFCWPAAVFSVLWALANRLWFAAFLLLALAIGLGAALDWAEADPAAEAAISLAGFLLIGFEANDWRRAGLARRGFEQVAVIAAPDLAAAEQRFFAERAADSPASALMPI